MSLEIMRHRTISIAVICTLVLLALSTCKPAGKSSRGGGTKLRVVTTLFPLYDMAGHIGDGKAEVLLLLPPGVEAHSFEPKAGDIGKINEADVFVYTGKAMEPWAEQIVRSVSNKDLIIVDASRGTKEIASVFHDRDEPAGAPDPHIWLDFDNAKTMVGNILRAFDAKHPSDGNFFDKNADEYDRKLTELDSEYRSVLSGCRRREIIYAGHYAFGYLARRYGLKYVAAQGVSPDSEPTAKDLVSLVDQIRREKVPYVFYEELTSPKIAETLAVETGARMLLLNAGHNITRDQLAKGTSFFDILKSDLENLKIGLECK